MELAEEQLQLSRALGDHESELSALQGIVAAALGLGDAQRAWLHVELMEALAARRSKVPYNVRHMKAETLRALGRLDEAEALYRQNLDQAEMAGDSGNIMHAAINLALLSLARPDMHAARTWIERVIELRAQGDHGVYGIPYILLVGAALHVTNHDSETAARLHGAADAHLQHTGQRLEPIDMAPLAPFLAQVRSAISGEAYAKAFDEGRALDQRSIISLAADCLPRRAS
jgi:tetratricopeptide (TPR) repeat protein